MKAYYTQAADQIFPIFGVNSLEEAKRYVDPVDHHRIIETDEDVYMNPKTGSVDFESGWEDLSEVIKVYYSAEQEAWVEA